MAATMVPPDELLPAVAAGRRIRPDGTPSPEVRAELRRIANTRSALTVAGAWLQSLGLLWGTAWLVGRTGAWPLWVPAFFLMGRAHALFGILGHEAAHRLLFSHRGVNDAVGRWLCNTPTGVVQVAYRRSHMAHHRDELGPDEPDTNLYEGYPITRASFRRKLWRDATGQSGWKIVKALGRPLRTPGRRRPIVEILLTQAVLFAVLGVTIGWWAWPVLWFAPWMTVWRVLNRLRGIAEHGGMERSADKRRTTHVVRQGWLARFWMVPYHTGWHLAHHVDAGVPWRNLPRLHAELVAAGYIPPGLERPSYTALWRAMRSRPEMATAATA